MSDLERSLRELAGPASEVDLDAVGRRADRIRRRRQGAVGGVAASLVVVAMVLVASAWDRGDEQSVVVAPPETTEAPETTEPAPSDEPEPEVSCPAPRLAPTYLPWAGELPDPVEPDRVDPTDAGSRALFLDDLAGALDGELDFFATMAVAISTRPSLDDVLGELDRSAFSVGELRGHEAFLVWIGDPGVGGMFIAWDEDDGLPCSAYRVEFPSTGPIADHLGLTAIHETDPVAPIEDELVRVVESLRHLEEVSSEEADIAQCPPPELHPTYVPWDAEDGPLEPVDQFEGDDGSTTTVYTDDPEGYERWSSAGVQVYVARMVDLGPAGLEAYRSMSAFGEIRGADGYLGWTGDVGIGPVWLAWEEDAGDRCGAYLVRFGMTYELSHMLGVPRAESDDTAEVITAELVRVVEALERR